MQSTVELISREDAATRLGVSIYKVITLVRQGLLQEVKLGHRTTRITLASLNALMEKK